MVYNAFLNNIILEGPSLVLGAPPKYEGRFFQNDNARGEVICNALLVLSSWKELP